MIHAVYDRPAHRLTVKGHAGAASHGEDLVCAAVSALVCTLAEAVRRLDRQEQAVIRLLAGDAEIAFASAAAALVQPVMDTVCLGLECLGAQYPAYIRYELKQGAGTPDGKENIDP